MVDQVLIAVFGMASIWLANDPRADVRRWAPIAGLAAQPAWMYATWQAGQWGIFALSFVYAAGWMRGLVNQWIVSTKGSNGHG